MDEIAHNLGICKTREFDMLILTSEQSKLRVKKEVSFMLNIKTSQTFELARKEKYMEELEI